MPFIKSFINDGDERSFEDQMTFAINGSYYDESDNKTESLLPENNTAKITYDNEKDMKSFLLLIEIAIKQWWKIDLDKNKKVL